MMHGGELYCNPIFPSPTQGLFFYYLKSKLIESERSMFSSPARGLFFNPSLHYDEGQYFNGFPSPSRGLFFIKNQYGSVAYFECFRPLLGDYSFISTLRNIVNKSRNSVPYSGLIYHVPVIPPAARLCIAFCGAVHHFSCSSVRTAPMPSAVLMPTPQ